MFNMNLKYYRLKKNLSKRNLAKLVDITPMAISHYENGDRRPNMEILKALDGCVTGFLGRRNDKLVLLGMNQWKKKRLKIYLPQLVGRFCSPSQMPKESWDSVEARLLLI